MADREYWKYFDKSGKSRYSFSHFFLMERIYE